MITLKLTQSVFEIQRSINEALAKELNNTVRKKKASTLGALRAATRSWITSSDAIESLLKNGAYELRTEFGLTNAEESVSHIINAVVDSVEVNFKLFNKDLRGNVTFNFQPQDNAKLLSMMSGYQMTKKGTDLHWLDWLLTKGDSTVIVGYSYVSNRRGRAGIGSMKQGGSFRVDPRYSGVIGNNFISKVFAGREQEVVKIIQESLL
jgi:hypothetical protein